MFGIGKSGAVGSNSVALKPIAQENGAIPAAQASIAQVQGPSKSTSAWNWTKENLPRIAYSVAIAAALALIGVGLSAGALSPLAIAGFSLGATSVLGAGIYEYKKASNIDNHARELYKAVKEFDDLNPNSNTYATAAERYASAKQAIVEDLIKLNPSDKEAFIRRIAAAAKKDSNFRINVNDGRYGINSDKAILTFELFVRSIVDSQVANVEKSYKQDLQKVAEKFADALKNDIMLSRYIEDAVNVEAYKINGNKAYRMLGKNLPEITQDLLDAVKDTLHAKYVGKEMRKMESLMTDRYGFWSEVENIRKKVHKEFDKKFDEKNKEIAGLEKQLRNIDASEKAMEKEKLSLLDYVRKTNNAPEKIAAAEAKIAGLDDLRKELNEQKDAIKQKIDEIKQELATIEGKLGSEYLIDLNARRRVFARLLGQTDVKDSVLPEHPTFGDKCKYWVPRAVGGLALAAGAVAGAYYGYPALKGKYPSIQDYENKAYDGLNTGWKWTTEKFASASGFISELFKKKETTTASA